MDPALHERRFAAALVTRGISSEPIYRLAGELLAESGVSGDLLDFGAGAGRFIADLCQAGYPGSITGVDILPRPASLPPQVAWIQADLNEQLPVPEASFDMIVSTEVIEHLENPRAIFRSFHRMLRTGGTLLVTTPNQESIRSLVGLLVGGHFVSFLGESYPAHITALVRTDFERICGEAGFAPPRFFFTNCGGIPKLPHLLWQKISFGLLKGRLFSDNLALLTRKL